MLYCYYCVFLFIKEIGFLSDVILRCKCFDKEICSDGLYIVKYERFVN